MSLILSSTVPPKTNYDVFLSFRGIDTRKNFTSHLYAALKQKHITTFMDDLWMIERGEENIEEISWSLLKAIEESKMSVIIFSKNYASSRWCLDELVKIMECMDSMDRMVLPVFYHVDPSDVRNQIGKFGEEFLKVKEKFKENVEKIETWISALRQAANLSGWDSGWDSNNYRTESELSEAVVNQILNKLYPAYFSACTDLSAIDSHINKLLSSLSIGSKDVRFIGIWGMGGIGKTTIAEVLLSRISDQFDNFYFESNVREKSEKDGLVQLRKCLFSKLLQNENLSMDMYHVIPTFILDMLRRKKVFIVLDDVNDSDKLEALAGNHDWFGPGSRVIVTSRDKEVLNDVDEIYEVKGLKYSNALQLLSMKAFKKKHPPKDFVELSERAVNYANGVPLALKVLGSHLCKRRIEEWENVLDKLKQTPDSKIQKVLEISYDTLEPSEKDIFLDIACFFEGQRKDWVANILNGCGLAASMGINRLMDKCLVVVFGNNLEMHDLIREMGQDIARRMGSRLWNATRIYDTLITETMKETVEGIFLDISKIGKVHLHPAIFSRVPNLRLLKFYRSCPDTNTDSIFELGQAKELQFLPNKISLFHWEDCPYNSLPSNFFMKNVVELNMKGSKVKQLWNGNKCPQRLKYLDLSECEYLETLPDLSSAPNLEDICLSNCKTLSQIPLSIQCLHNLYALDLRGCEKLRSLPRLAQLGSLSILSLNGCSNLQMLVDVPRGLKFLFLGECGLEEWFQEDGLVCNLQIIDVRNCKNLRSLPSSDCLNSVKKLSLKGCSSLSKFPENIGNNITKLDLSYTMIEDLPSTILRLSSLYELDVEGCKRLENLSVNICLLKSLGRLNLSGCSKLSKLPDLHGLCYLRQLFLNNCNKLEGLPKLPSQLEVLEASNCRLLKTAVSCIRPIEPGQLRGAAFKFNFVNCLNLDQNARSNIMGDAELRIKEIAICMVSL
ncbi:disease resistance protein RPV1-like [Jatropha curcas]|uniref:disease resistance protein RPV1-like n=1 Tax=Jatropha curcas TaxID=180498 RepID=UPI001893C7B2|nr:disease resistance protein RPV1-like [Jatropha curcas]